jgi:hypothetical protein
MPANVPAAASPPICRACGEVIIAGSGVVIITVEPAGRSGQRLTACADCARLILARLRARPAGLAGAAAE